MSEENSYQPVTSAAELQQRYAQGERNFSKAQLQGADLRDSDLKGVNLQEANLKGANLRGANLKEANLQGASFKEADLKGANLSAANLKRAYLGEAYLELAILQGTNLQEANLRGANLGGARLVGANLEKADMTFADCSDTYMISQGGSGGADLQGANLQGADLSKANLHGANLSGANLKEAHLKGSLSQGAYYDGNTRFPASFDIAGSGMQKSHNSSKTLSSSGKPSSSGPKTNMTSAIAAASFIALACGSVAVVNMLAEGNKSKTAGIAKAESEVEVSYEANEAVPDADYSGTEHNNEANLNTNKPAVQSQTSDKSVNKPTVKVNVAIKINNQPAAESQNAAKAANKPNSTSTSDPKRKTSSTSATKSAGVISTPKARIASCPALVRAINAANPDAPSAVDININGKKVISNVPFSQASRYISVPHGLLYVQIVKAGTQTVVDERTFTAAPNNAYSVALTGPLSGPQGQLFNKSPFVMPEDLSPPSPGNFKGRWYKLSEMKAPLDLRIAMSDVPNTTQARLVDVAAKTAAAYPEVKAGTYNFNTVLPKKSDPIVNKAYKPPIKVEIAKAKIPAGTIFDIFAIGNTLDRGNNSLKLSAASYKALPPTADGCMRVQ